MTLFPTRILLATDGSEEAELATRTTVGLAGDIDAELHVVYVEPLPEFLKNGDSQVGFDRELYEKIEAESRKKPQKASARL